MLLGPLMWNKVYVQVHNNLTEQLLGEHVTDAYGYVPCMQLTADDKL